MKKKWIIIGLILSVFTIGGAMIGTIMSNVEQPKYDVIDSPGEIEKRQYAPMIIAQVEVDGKREDSIRDGFRLLADYIFGNNNVKQKIAMTAPVQQQLSNKFDTTTPKNQQSAENSWLVSFIMPSQYSMEQIPKPNDDRIILKEISAKKFVTITFSGKNSGKNLEKNEKKLMRFIEINNISVILPLKYAFYNPPWTLSLMRRNEIMIEIE